MSQSPLPHSSDPNLHPPLQPSNATRPLHPGEHPEYFQQNPQTNNTHNIQSHPATGAPDHDPHQPGVPYAPYYQPPTTRLQDHSTGQYPSAYQPGTQHPVDPHASQYQPGTHAPHYGVDPHTQPKPVPYPPAPNPPSQQKQGGPPWALIVGGVVLILIVAGIVGAVIFSKKAAPKVAAVPTINALTPGSASPIANAQATTPAKGKATTIASKNGKGAVAATPTEEPPTAIPTPTEIPRVATQEWGLLLKNKVVARDAPLITGKVIEDLNVNTLIAWQSKLADGSWYERVGGGWVARDDFVLYRNQAEAKAALPTPNAAFGAGQELVGQRAIDKNDGGRNMTFVVFSVDRLIEIKTLDGKTLYPAGVFLVVQFNVSNSGSGPSGDYVVNLVDSKGRKYAYSTNSDVTYALDFTGKYHSDTRIQSGLTGRDYKVFDVPADGAGFKLVGGS